uniref:(northern house mosquito) hypothetical protein n=1 Tax=Culex pipiens TaxID=7175 RepID=A0A8D8H5H4_CULPI
MFLLKATQLCARQSALRAFRSSASRVLASLKQQNVVSAPCFLRIQPLSSTAARLASPKSMKEEHYRKKDKVPLDFRLVYRAPMEHYLAACNVISSFSFVAFAGISSYAYLQHFHTMAVPFDIEYGTLTANENDLMVFLGFFLFANVVIRLMVNRYTLRVYRKNEKYIAVFEGYLPFTRRQIQFKGGEVTAVPEGGILPWQDARYKINDKPVLLLDGNFRTPSELNAMMKHER